MNQINAEFITCICAHRPCSNCNVTLIWFNPGVMDMTMKPKVEVSGNAMLCDVSISVIQPINWMMHQADSQIHFLGFGFEKIELPFCGEP